MAISKIILNGVTQMDLTQDTVTAAHLETSYIAHGANGNSITGALSPSTDYVVTLLYNSQSEMWTPDKTYAEISAAATAGKTIAIVANGNGLADGRWNSSILRYSIVYDLGDGMYNDTYELTASELTLVDKTDMLIPNFETKNVTYSSTSSTQTYTLTPNTANDYNGIGQVNVTIDPAQSAGRMYERLDPNGGYITENGVRKWQARAEAGVGEAGWVENGVRYGDWEKYSAIATGTTVTPTESAQTIGGAGTMMEGAVTVDAIPSNYVGSGITRRDGDDIQISGATFTAPAGYYSTSASKSLATMTLPSTTSGSNAGTKKADIFPSTSTDTYLNIPEGYNSSQQYYKLRTLMLASKTVTANGTYVAGDDDLDGFSSVVVNVSGGSSGMQIATKTTTLDSASASISFSGLSGEPTSFAITTAADLATGASPWKTAVVTFDGTNLNGQIVTNTSNAQASHSTSFTKSYSNGTLTVTGTGTNFQANQYRLVYTYGGTSANLGTDDVQVGSGATSISFTGLSAEPDYFSLVFTSDFSTSSGYQRVMAVVYDGNSTYGVAMDSGAKALSSWSYTYNNGTLTVSSTGTNNGGYFHQPGDYHLTYGIGGTVEPVEIDVQPLSVTQNGTYTAPDGVAYSPVTVNVSGGGSTNVATTTWTNSSTSTVSHQFTGLSGTPKAAFLRCTSQLTRSSNNTYYYIADIVWDGTNARGNYHLRSNGSYNDVPSTATAKYNVTVGTNSITFSSTATSRSSAPGSFYNGTYELTYVY